jgi:hypothetical protein
VSADDCEALTELLFPHMSGSGLSKDTVGYDMAQYEASRLARIVVAAGWRPPPTPCEHRWITYGLIDPEAGPPWRECGLCGLDEPIQISPDCDACFGQGCQWCASRQAHDYCYCPCTPRHTDDEGKHGTADTPEAWPS